MASELLFSDPFDQIYFLHFFYLKDLIIEVYHFL